VARVLIADDELGICRAFAELLRREGHEPVLASSGEQALAEVETARPALVFMDIQMPGMGGLEALARLREREPELPVVVMTAYGTMDTALEAVSLGAFDYIGKPVELAQVRKLLARALQPRSAPAAEPAQDPQGAGGEGALVGRSPAMQEIFKLVSLLTGNDMTVLVSGETGVGKELVARAIHRHSRRREAPFVAVNCAAIPETLVESELFGHVKGAFTGAEGRRIGRFEAAAAGTLFLDEISELPLHLQSKLLRVLQERSYEPVGSVGPQPLEARVIAASNLDLRRQVERGAFREDLFHRLNLVTLNIPPLRERRGDIALLAEHFLHRVAAELGKPVTYIEPAALERLQAWDWPGNVRELENCVRRAALLAPGASISEHELELDAPAPAERGGADAAEALARAARRALAEALERGDTDEPFHRLVELVERELVGEALQRSGDNQVAAARLLGLHRTTLRKKLDQGPAR
jgi:nitrogen regulation protein NR(I)